ncbi:MAG TPA: methionine--tRNA ligase [Gemmataceae bacterium]|nr:methionine--tRNA ligase [Gemmataceae bacterium]
MSDRKTWFQTTAIDYPNSRPHIGTAFEKLGADVQARYRRMEGFDVCFLMGNDENTTKVSKRAVELSQETQAYADDMARQFREVWDALEITYDVFIQTSSERHKQCCRKFIQKVFDNGFIYKGSYAGWYCEGCEEFKSDKQHEENNGLCPNHRTPLVRRSEPCYFFKLSAFSDRLLAHYEANPDFIQPEIRKNEIVSLIKTEGLRDINISRAGEEWGIRIPFDPEFTIYVWFDALLTYITGIGYGDDEATFKKNWPCDTHFIGKDITRFHTALWPAMLWAAGEEAPKRVFAHGFVYFEGGKISKSRADELKKKGLEYLFEPMEIVRRFSAEAFRYYFLRECPFPADGDFSPDRFIEVYNSELPNNLGNLLSRCVTVAAKNFQGVLEGTGGRNPIDELAALGFGDLPSLVGDIRATVERCQYNLTLQRIIQEVCTPANRFLDQTAPWKLVKTGNADDLALAKQVIYRAVQVLRVASILLKPFIPKSAETIYRSFNFPTPWAEVKYADAAELQAQPDDLRVTAELVDGKVKPLFPRIG